MEEQPAPDRLGSEEIRRPENRTVGRVAAMTIAGSVAVDQISKLVAVSALMSGPVDLRILRLRLVANRGILLGLHAPTVVIVLATLGVLAVALQAIRRADLAASVGYGLIAGGAIGNLADRLVERSMFPPQAVVDWISFGGITFNLADVAVVAGALVALGGPWATGSRQHRPADGSGEAPHR